MGVILTHNAKKLRKNLVDTRKIYNFAPGCGKYAPEKHLLPHNQTILKANKE
jgi:hypothetical protein